MANLETDYNGVREYIGARYVPVFADPVEWSDTRAYEPLTIVTYQGASYTSARYIPTGIPISDESYWVRTFDFDAQVEAYRTETRKVASDLANETQARISGDTALSNRITTNANAISTETTNRQNADTEIHNVLDKLGVAVTKVDFINTNGKDQWGIKLTFTDEKQRLLYCGDDFIRYFDSVEQEQLWTIDSFARTYDIKDNFRINYRNNIAVVNMSGYIFNWVKTDSNEWIQVATAAEMGLTFPPGETALHYYGVLNVNYEDTAANATLRIGPDGAWCRMSGSESGSYFLYGQCAMTATAHRAETFSATLDVNSEVNVVDGWVILIDA